MNGITAEDMGEMVYQTKDTWNINIGLPGGNPTPPQQGPTDAMKTRRNIYIGLGIVAVLVVAIVFVKSK